MSDFVESRIRIPEEALAEFEEVEKMDWGVGITLSSLISWINTIEDLYRPDKIDSRSGKQFTERSFRHYQTMGAIDPPKRVGKKAMYGFRQYLQALVVRKLLWERVPAEQIVAILQGKSNEQCKNLLFQGIEIVPRMAPSDPDRSAHSHLSTGRWRRHTIAAGVELHLEEGSPKRNKEENQEILSEILRILSES